MIFGGEKMFKPRTSIVENDEIDRQREIQQVLVYNRKPRTLLQKKASAIVNHGTINPIIRSKILKRYDEIFDMFFDNNNNNNNNIDQSVVDKIDGCFNTDNNNDDDADGGDGKSKILIESLRNYIKSVEFEFNDELLIPTKAPTLEIIRPDEMKSYTNVLLKTEPINTTSILEFETIMFNNKIRYRYFEKTKFVEYLYYNMMYLLNVKSEKELIGNRSWQARFVLLLHKFNLNETLAQQIFYEDEIEYLGNYYDCSFVPKYDVKRLVPQKEIKFERTNRTALIEYYRTLDVRKTSRVPTEYTSIFTVFPFKDGHYIQPNGNIVFVNTFTNVRKSSKFIIREACNVGDFETAIEDASRSITLDEAVYYALYANNLNELALALMVIRRLTGNVLHLNGYRITLANETTLMSWITFTCSPNKLLLPPYYSTEDGIASDTYLNLIQSIAMSCCSKLGCSIMCGAYYLPEIHYSDLYERLSNDAEKYVFFTLILQNYPLKMYHHARKRLTNTQFGTMLSADQLLQQYRHLISTRPYYDTTMAERLKMITEQLLSLRPTDLNASTVDNQNGTCPPYKCSEYYEFTNEQLAELAKTGTASTNAFDDFQIAGYLTLLIDKTL